MNTEQTNSDEQRASEDSPQQKESLKELAGELLGVNLNSSSNSSEDVSLDDLDWGELKFAPSETRDAKPEDEISPDEISSDEISSVVAKSKQQESTLDESDKQDSGVEEFEQPHINPVEDDDPLAAWDNPADDWNWDENQQKSSDRDDEKTIARNDKESEIEAAVEPSSGSVGLSTQDEDPETAEDFVSEYEDNPFGLGLFEEETEETSDRPRRRTRRKKQASSKKEDFETKEPNVSVETEDEFVEIENPMEEGDDFGADLNLGDEKPRTRRAKKTVTVKKTPVKDRSRSRERKPKEVERHSKKRTSGSLDEKKGSQQTSEVRAENKPEIASATKADYRDIPSWEEAISFLLNPGLVNTEKDDSSPNKKTASKKQTRKTTGRAKTAPRKRKRRR